MRPQIFAFLLQSLIQVERRSVRFPDTETIYPQPEVTPSQPELVNPQHWCRPRYLLNQEWDVQPPQRMPGLLDEGRVFGGPAQPPGRVRWTRWRAYGKIELVLTVKPMQQPRVQHISFTETSETLPVRRLVFAIYSHYSHPRKSHGPHSRASAAAVSVEHRARPVP